MAINLSEYGFSDKLVRAGQFKPLQLDHTIRKVIHAPVTFAQASGEGADGNELRLPVPSSTVQSFPGDDGRTTINGDEVTPTTTEAKLQEEYERLRAKEMHWVQIEANARRTAENQVIDPNTGKLVNLDPKLRADYKNKYLPFASAQLAKHLANRVRIGALLDQKKREREARG